MMILVGILIIILSLRTLCIIIMSTAITTALLEKTASFFGRKHYLWQ
jgi:hypothetical protein